MRALSFIALVAVPIAAMAQTGDIPKTVLDGLSRDLASLQKTVLEVQGQQQPGSKIVALLGRVAVIEPTDLKAGAADNAPSIFRAEKGSVFPVVAEARGWYAVETAQPYQGSRTAWLRAAAAMPVAQDTTQMSASELVFAKLTESAARFKQNYQNNQYITVSGFVVNTVPPSISINFEFKK